MKHFIYILVFFSSLQNIKGQNVPLINENNIKDYLIYIVQPISDTTFELGTGFLINYNNSYYLVTAKHVAKELNRNASLVLNNNGFKIWTSISEFSDKVDFINHETADISVLKFNRPILIDMSNRFKKYSFSISQLYKDKSNIDRTLTLTLAGFPYINPILDKEFTPIILTSNYNNGLVSIKDNVLGFNQLCYILNIPSIGGMSGGPVFANVQKGGINMSLPEGQYNGTYVMGIVSATQRDNTGGKLGYVTPIFYIFDLIK